MFKRIKEIIHSFKKEIFPSKIVYSKMNDDDDQDVLYVTFGTGEPSFCEEIDDFLLIERGIDSKEMTGYRLLFPLQTISKLKNFNKGV